MRPYQVTPTNWAWNFVGFGLMWFLIGSGWSVARAKSYQIELAQYKLEVGTALSQVKKVSDTLEQTAQTSAIAPHDKRKIQRLTKQSEAVIERLESDIEQESERLSFTEQNL